MHALTHNHTYMTDQRLQHGYPTYTDGELGTKKIVVLIQKESNLVRLSGHIAMRTGICILTLRHYQIFPYAMTDIYSHLKPVVPYLPDISMKKKFVILLVSQVQNG